MSVEKGLMGTCATSKYYSYLQGGKPVLAVVEKESYIAKEVVEKSLGYSCEVGDTKGLSAAIIKLLESPEDRIDMSKRAKETYMTNYAYEVSMAKYDSLMDHLCKGDGSFR